MDLRSFRPITRILVSENPLSKTHPPYLSHPPTTFNHKHLISPQKPSLLISSHLILLSLSFPRNIRTQLLPNLLHIILLILLARLVSGTLVCIRRMMDRCVVRRDVVGLAWLACSHGDAQEVNASSWVIAVYATR